MDRGPRTTRPVVATLALCGALLLAACGSSDDGDAGSDVTAAAGTVADDTGDSGDDDTGDDGASEIADAGAEVPVEPAGVDATCQVVADELIEVDVANPTDTITGVYVVAEIGKSSGDRDDVTVHVRSMAPGERAVMPFEIIGASRSDCTVLEIDPLQSGGFLADEAADFTSCEVVDDGGSLAVDATLLNSGTDTADYISTAGLYDTDGVRRYQADTSFSDTPPGEAVTERTLVGADYVDGLTCTVHEAFRRPER